MSISPESFPGPAHTAQGESAAVSCCSAFYEQDWVRQLAEDIFHPGGESLTRRTVAAMKLPEHASIADLGCGTGTSAILLASQLNLQVSAVDISAANMERAAERVESAGIAMRLVQADVHDLPFSDREFDAVLAECTFSLFSDQARVLAEIHRVLKPGGQLAITDMATSGPLPGDMADMLAPWTCLADATDQETYIEKFKAAGFSVREIADESESLNQMILVLKRKLLLLSAGSLMGGNSLPDIDPGFVRYWLNRFKAEVETGLIRYLRFNLQYAG
jgi:ubiquinone/menaquinone biosynthesis C-methylase UbiE